MNLSRGLESLSALHPISKKAKEETKKKKESKQAHSCSVVEKFSCAQEKKLGLPDGCGIKKPIKSPHMCLIY